MKGAPAIRKNPGKAFRWIIDLLERHAIPYQVTGGLAARTYGSDRELADIDLDIPERLFQSLRPLVEAHIEFGPLHFKDDQWDLDLMTLNYEGQKIDLGGAYEARIFDRQAQKWVQVIADFSTAERRRIFERDVPVVAIGVLIDYKKKLARDVDLIWVGFDSC